jgi:hypothetical protein
MNGTGEYNEVNGNFYLGELTDDKKDGKGRYFNKLS